MQIKQKTRRILLQFVSLHQLWDFATTLNAVSLQVNEKERKLLYDCTQEQLNTILNRYNDAEKGICKLILLKDT